MEPYYNPNKYGDNLEWNEYKRKRGTDALNQFVDTIKGMSPVEMQSYSLETDIVRYESILPFFLPSYLLPFGNESAYLVHIKYTVGVDAVDGGGGGDASKANVRQDSIKNAVLITRNHLHDLLYCAAVSETSQEFKDRCERLRIPIGSFAVLEKNGPSR